MKTVAELREWRAGAEEEFGDASIPVCQLFFRWTFLRLAARGELVCGPIEGRPDHIGIVLDQDVEFALPVVLGPPELFVDGVEKFGLTQIVPGVWAVSPSLNLTGLVHAFLVLYDVPDPAPWEQRVILAP